MITTSEERELKLYRFAESYSSGQWKPTSMSSLMSFLQFHEWGVLVDTLDDLHKKELLEIRKPNNPFNGWLEYDGRDRDSYFKGDFYIKVTPDGRKEYEHLEAQAADESRVDRMPVARLLAAAEHQASLRELREAHSDLIKRPEPDLTGVVQHCMAALECTAKLIAGFEAGTLHDVLKSGRLNLPPHLAAMVDKAWGFASDRARHVKEGKPVSYPDAELMLNLCEAVIVYLLRCHGGSAAA